jgi:hypothetical protein
LGDRLTHSAEAVYEFVTNPANWTKTYPGSAHIGKLPGLPLKVGDTREEAGPGGDRIFNWQLAIADRPTPFVFNSVGRLGHDRQGDGGMEDRITVAYRFSRPGRHITLFSRTMTIEAYKHARCPTRSSSRPIRRGSTPTTRPLRASRARLTPTHVVRDTLAVFCKGGRFVKGLSR